jgi:hypothetical protein
MRFDRKDRECTVAGSGVFLCVGGERTKGQLFHKNGRAPMRSGPSSRQDLTLVMVSSLQEKFSTSYYSG